MNTILHSAVHEIPLSTLFWMDQLVTGEEASDMFKVWTLEGWSTILKKTQPDSTRGRCKRTCRYPTAVGGPTSCYASISKSEMFNEWDGPNVLATELISECSQHKKWRVRIRRTKDHTNLTSSSLVYWVRQTYNMESNGHELTGVRQPATTTGQTGGPSKRKHPAVFNKAPHILIRICATSVSSKVTPNVSPTLMRRTDQHKAQFLIAMGKTTWLLNLKEDWDLRNPSSFNLYRKRGLFYPT